MLGAGRLNFEEEGRGRFGQCENFTALINKEDIFSNYKAVHDMELITYDFTPYFRVLIDSFKNLPIFSPLPQ